MVAGLSALFVYMATPPTCGGCVGETNTPWEILIAGILVGLLAMVVKLFAQTRAYRLITCSGILVLINTLGFPAIVTLLLKSPASSGMPSMIYAFWLSIALYAVLVVIVLRPSETTAAAKFTIGGGIGLAGFALLLTQFSVASEGYEAVIPVIQRPGDTRLAVRENFQLTVRFDTGFVQRAYLEKGLYRVTRPIYYRYVDYTFEYPGTKKPASSGRTDLEGYKTYMQAIQGLTTLGLVKQYDANVGTAPGAPPSQTPTPVPTTAGTS